MHSVCWGALTNFPCKLRLQNLFSALGVQAYPLHPLATPMDRIKTVLVSLTQSSVEGYVKCTHSGNDDLHQHNGMTQFCSLHSDTRDQVQSGMSGSPVAVRAGVSLVGR